MVDKVDRMLNDPEIQKILMSMTWRDDLGWKLFMFSYRHGGVARKIGHLFYRGGILDERLSGK